MAENNKTPEKGVILSPQLARESEQLVRAWMRHNNETLKSYLVQDVQDPRINPQSIHARHILIDLIDNTYFKPLQFEELRFSAAMLWILNHKEDLSEPYFRSTVLKALETGSKDADGIQIPAGLIEAFQILPLEIIGIEIPNYIQMALEVERQDEGFLCDEILDIFVRSWSQILKCSQKSSEKLNILEPACGSANDYRIIRACGLTQYFDYVGVDICPKNIDNAKEMYPDARFQIGNAFALEFADKSFDAIVVHDLFEHLSEEAIYTGLSELCRVCKSRLFIGFFNMWEEENHIIRPYKDYHWNTLSLNKVREIIHKNGALTYGFNINVWINSFFKFGSIYNPNAYSIVAEFPQKNL